MDSFSKLPYTLSLSQAAVFQRLQDDALFPTLARPGEGELVQLFKAKKREEEIARVAPYADLLEIQFKEMITERKDSILQQLRDSKTSSFCVDLFSWTTVLYNESISDYTRRCAEMAPEKKIDHGVEQRLRHIHIKEMGWESTFGVKVPLTHPYNPEDDENYCWSHYPLKVDRIFRNSDLAERLSMLLGPNFYPSTRMEYVGGTEEYEEFGYRAYKKTLFVRYYPFGVSKQQMTKLMAVAKKQTERAYTGEKIVRYDNESYPEGHEMLCVLPEPEDEYADMPPLIPAPSDHHCSCGCAYYE
jgi:hypothetical protein